MHSLHCSTAVTYLVPTSRQHYNYRFPASRAFLFHVPIDSTASSFRFRYVLAARLRLQPHPASSFESIALRKFAATGRIEQLGLTILRELDLMRSISWPSSYCVTLLMYSYYSRCDPHWRSEDLYLAFYEAFICHGERSGPLL